jgi:HK97 family phage prohead protease
VPFGQPQLVADVVDGRLLVSVEQFDRDSFAALPERVPLLVSHDSGQPIGWARPSLEPDALRVEARLEGGAAHLDHVIELVKAGLMSAMSIGFGVSADDVWTKGPSPDSPPRVLRRGAKLRDVSLVTRPAYVAARVETLRHRTALKIASDLEMADYNARKAREEAEAEAAGARQEWADELDAWLEQTRRRGDELRAVFARRTAPPEPPKLKAVTGVAAVGTPTSAPPPPSDPPTHYETDYRGGIPYMVRCDEYGNIVETIGRMRWQPAGRSMCGTTD